MPARLYYDGDEGACRAPTLVGNRALQAAIADPAAGWWSGWQLDPFATSDLLTPGESVVVTVTGIQPGTYQYWCTIEDHYTFGSRGVLTVQ